MSKFVELASFHSVTEKNGAGEKWYNKEESSRVHHQDASTERDRGEIYESRDGETD